MAKRRANGEGEHRQAQRCRHVRGVTRQGLDPDTGKSSTKNVLAKTQKECKENMKRAIEENSSGYHPGRAVHRGPVDGRVV